MIGQRKLVVGIVAAGLLFGAGCSKDKKDTVYKGPNGESVSIDENGNVKASDGKGNDVTYSTNGNGDISGSGSDGDSSFSSGGGTKLPDDWPDDLKPPKAIKLTAAITNTSNGKKTRTVSGETTSGSARDVYDGVKQQLQDADYEIAGDNFFSGSSGDGGTLSASNDKYDVSVLVGSDGKKTTVTFSITDK